MLVSYLTSHKGSIHHLEACIKSVYLDLQTSGINLTNYEHLIWLDGESVDVLPSHFFDFPSVRFFSSYTTKGKSYCVNRLIDLSCGQYLFFIDSDDLNIMGRTSKQLDYICNRENLMIGSNFLYLQGKSSHGSSEYPLSNVDIKINFWSYPFLLYSSLCVARDNLLRTGIYFNEDIRAGLDYEFYSRILAFLSVENIKQPLVFYRINKYGISQTSSTRSIQLKTHFSVLNHLLSETSFDSASLCSVLFECILNPSAKLSSDQKDQLSTTLDSLNSILHNGVSHTVFPNYFPDDLSQFAILNYFISLFKRVLATQSHLP